MEEANAIQSLANKFSKNFNPRDFVTLYMDPEDGTLRQQSYRTVEHWYSVLEKVKPLEGRLLDFGTGCVIASLLAASKEVDSIVASGYLEAERNELAKWLRDEPGAIKWKQCLELAAKLEGNGVTGEDIAHRLREKVQQVLACDVHNTNPLDTPNLEQFDVVTCQLVLGSSCPTEELYRAGAANLARLVKPGGRLLLLTAIEAEYYIVEGHKFETLSVNSSFLQSVLEPLGLNQLEFYLSEGVVSGHASVNKGLCITHAWKSG